MWHTDLKMEITLFRDILSKKGPRLPVITAAHKSLHHIQSTFKYELPFPFSALLGGRQGRRNLCGQWRNRVSWEKPNCLQQRSKSRWRCFVYYDLWSTCLFFDSIKFWNVSLSRSMYETHTCGLDNVHNLNTGYPPLQLNNFLNPSSVEASVSSTST